MTGPAPASPLALRPATADDAAALARVDAATSMQPWSALMFRAEVARGDRWYVVAGPEDDPGEVVGYAGIARLADEVHVMGIAVLPSQQGQGCGRQLLTALCREAAASSAAMLLEVRPSNTSARHLYRTAGFTQVGRRPGYYPDGEDALLLWRPADDRPRHERARDDPASGERTSGDRAGDPGAWQQPGSRRGATDRTAVARPATTEATTEGG